MENMYARSYANYDIIVMMFIKDVFYLNFNEMYF